MTWEEAVLFARGSGDLSRLIESAYLSDDLISNISRYGNSAECREINKHLTNHFGSDQKLKILDIGAGNGITSVNFSLAGHSVLALEPDESNHVGAGAIQHLKDSFSLDNLEIVSAFAEDLDVGEQKFDLVFVRQAMHHANNLESFVKNTSRFLRAGGLYFTVRDHVIFDQKDKDLFLKSHPLHKFYGGENAYTSDEYRTALQNAGLQIASEIRYFESPINLAPLDLKDIEDRVAEELDNIKQKLKLKLGSFGGLDFVSWLYRKFKNDPMDWLDERKMPGRMYSYLSVKS